MLGKRFGRLVVNGLSENVSGKRKRLMYYCSCDCGSVDVEVVGEKLRSGSTKSCGCLQKEKAHKTHKKYNVYDVSGEYGIGITINTNNMYLFDIEDYEIIKEYCWLELKNGYIASRDSKTNKYVYLHRIVMKASKNDVIDHKNHDKHDNRKRSLRIGTQSNNMMNTSMRIDNTSGITGVYQDKRNGRWISEIHYKNKKIFLGSFENKDDAIATRRKAEEYYFDEWSYKKSTGKYNNE